MKLLKVFSSLRFLLLALCAATPAAHAATVGTQQTASFGSAEIQDFCDISLTNGQLAATTDLTAIGSTTFYLNGRSYSATPQSTTVTVTTSLASAAVVADGVVFTGTTTPESAILRFGDLVNVDVVSGLTVTQSFTSGVAKALDLFFSASNSQVVKTFSPGTYSASVTLTCTDNGIK